MSSQRSALAYGSTAFFVLLWGSGGVFSKWALTHASTFTFLSLRFAAALLLLLVLCRGHWLPARGTRLRVASIGLLLIGGYSSCYFLALEHGVTPGLLATIMGVQPILTLVALERRGSLLRAVGLACALAGLALAVHQSIGAARISPLGMTFALGALTAMTLGALLQKAEKQSPLQVLPLQYAASLALCAMLIGAQPVRLEVNASLIVALLWLGLVFSVGAQLLFYRLIQRGNLVNVTSLFYLVPVMTAILDYLVLGNAMSGATLAGLALIIIGLGFVFRRSDRPPTA